MVFERYVPEGWEPGERFWHRVHGRIVGTPAYQRWLDTRNRQRPLNMFFSYLVTRGLESSGMRQPELADRLGLSPSAISQYARGIRIPEEGIAARLFSELRLPYTSLRQLEACVADEEPGGGAGLGHGNL